MTAPSLSQIRAQVQEVLERWPERRRIGIRSPADWSGPSSVELELQGFDGLLRVVPCRSSLELRQRLLEAEGSRDVWVFLADLAPTELEADLRSRLAKGRLLEPERWQTARGLFGARHVDPRLVRHGWIADLLIDASPPGGFRPVASGVLDEDTARRALLEHYLGLGGEASPAAILRWASAPDTQERYASAPEELRSAFAEWLAPAAGPLAEVLAALLAAGHGVDAVPLGLVADVLWGVERSALTPARESSVLLLSERYLDRLRPSPEAARSWAEAAVGAVRRRADDGFDAVEPWLRRAEEVLEELGATALASAGEWLPRAFEERLARAVGSLERWLRDRGSALTAAEAAAAELGRHGLAAGRYEPRVRALTRALALARWLASPPPAAADLGAAVLGYADDGAWVDLARQHVGRGDTSEAAAKVYERLASAVEAERERQNRRFAELLRDAGAAAPEHPRVAGVEDVLARWAAPLAQRGPLLVLVLDGLGQVVWRQLREGLLREVWREVVPVGATPAGRGVALAVLPTETRTSRVSLCCGRLAEGTSAEERRGFAAHPSFASSRRPPLLFAPGEVKSAGGGVAPEVVAEILGQRPVVGVVVPDVDAYFESMSDLRSPFEVETLGPLRDLLQLAGTAGRWVLITGDHGQVPGGGTELRRPEGETRSRHRAGAEEPGEGEIAIAGRRVLAAGNQVVVPWSERPRYRKGGRAAYHGGATPQEMVVPVVVLAGRGVEVEGWQPLDELPPPWWEAPVTVTAGAPASKAAGASAQMSLLEASSPETSEAGGWLDRLLASEVFAQQRRLAGRRPPPEAQVRRLLAVLAAEGGAATLPALARRLDTARLRGLLTQASRLLNVDGFGVLTVDEASETVRLDRPLLEKQFGLAEPRR